MANLIALLFVAFVIVIGIGSCWVITASGSATPVATDTFGNTPSSTAMIQDNQSSGMAVAAMPTLFISFFVMVCVILCAGMVWLWKTGKTKVSGY